MVSSIVWIRQLSGACLDLFQIQILSAIGAIRENLWVHIQCICSFCASLASGAYMVHGGVCVCVCCAWLTVFAQIKHIRLVGMLLVVYVRDKHVEFVQDVEAQMAGTGLMGMMVSSAVDVSIPVSLRLEGHAWKKLVDFDL